MTITKCIKQKGWQCEVNGPLKRYQLVDVSFVNPDDSIGETQFCITNAGTAGGIRLLTKLFLNFCDENNFKVNTVTGITIVAAADKPEELY